jgi:cell division protein ZapA
VKQIEVTILGQSYRLGCPEGGEDTLLAAVAAVDREMSAIRDAGKVRARERMAVLAALNLAYQLVERGSAPTPTPTPAPAPAAAGPDDERLRALITRIDAALGEDGRLL